MIATAWVRKRSVLMEWDKSDFIVAGMCPVYLNIKELDASLGPGSGCTKPHI